MMIIIGVGVIFLLSIHATLSFIHDKFYRHQHHSLFAVDDQTLREQIAKDPQLAEYLKGPEGKPWKGSRSMLIRRKQIPDISYGPVDVVKICLDALQNNDDPQLDHGACVVLEFKSPTGLLAQEGLDPAAYGRFLRSTEYKSLIDFKLYRVEGQPIELMDSLSVKLPVKIVAWKDLSGNNEKNAETSFEFYLTKTKDLWLVDVILAK